MKDSEIEKILTNFDDSEVSDLEDSDESDVINNLFDAFDSNKSFLLEELSREGPYEINIQDIDVVADADEGAESAEIEEDVLDRAEVSNKSPIIFETPEVPLKKADQFRWKKTNFLISDKTFMENYPKQDIKLPVGYFLEYFTEDFLQSVVYATNHGSLIKCGKSINLTTEELFRFLALELMIGIIGYPRLEMYWALGTVIPVFPENMSRQRFHLIRNNLKFTTNSTENDKLYKIRPLINMFTQKSYNFPKDENLCVDEMMVPFKGTTGLRQYMPKKPTKWGMKIFCLCSSKGIVYDFEIYQGKGTILNQSKLGFCSDIVIHLSKTIPEHSNHKLYFDNYFTTLNLILYLRQKGIWSTGTIRGNRFGKIDFKTEKDLQKEGRGSFDFRVERSDNIFLLRWLDGSIVQLLSSIHGHEPLKMVSRFCAKEKKRIQVAQPNIVTEYNKNMGGVDKMDFLLSLYRISIRSRKWTLKIFDHFIDMAVCNSWLEYRIDHNSSNSKAKYMDLLQFRNDIVNGLIARSNQQACSRKRGRPMTSLSQDLPISPTISQKRRKVTPATSIRYDGNQHWPEYNKNKGRCKAKECAGQTRYRCVKCDVLLCIPNGSRNCFKDYHYISNE